MMEKKYTPGPWRVFENMALDDLLVESDMGEWKFSTRRIAADKETLIAEVSIAVGCKPGYPDAAKDEFLPNARLIAAAPELVEALDAAPIIEAYYINGELESERFMADYEAWWQTRNETLVKAGVIG